MSYTEYTQSNILNKDESNTLGSQRYRRLRYYEEFIKAYGEASATVQGMDQLFDQHKAASIKETPATATVASSFLDGGFDTMATGARVMGASAAHLAKQQAWAKAAGDSKQKLVQKMKTASSTGGNNQQINALQMKPTWGQVRAMLQERTTNLQERMDSFDRNVVAGGGAMTASGYCTCEEPIPVPMLGSQAMYCNCDAEEADPEDELTCSDMYCTCSDPIPVPLGFPARFRNNKQHKGPAAAGKNHLVGGVDLNELKRMAASHKPGRHNNDHPHPNNNKGKGQQAGHLSAGELMMYLRKPGGVHAMGGKGGRNHSGAQHQHQQQHHSKHNPDRFNIHDHY